MSAKLRRFPQPAFLNQPEDPTEISAQGVPMKKLTGRIRTMLLLPSATTVCLFLGSICLRVLIDSAGNVPNLKWSFSLSHTRLLNGGWIREQTVTDLPPCELPLIELRTWLPNLDFQRRTYQPPSFGSPRMAIVNCTVDVSNSCIHSSLTLRFSGTGTASESGA